MATAQSTWSVPVILSVLAHLDRERDRLRDPTLTVLAALLVFILFGHIPLAAMGVFDPPVLNVAVGLLILAAVVVVSRKPAAVAAILLASAVGIGAAQIRSPGVLVACTIHAAAALFLIALSWVVADAVFAPGRVTMHRVLGAIVLYLNVGGLFLVLYSTLVLLSHRSFTGLPGAEHHAALRAGLCYFSFETLTSSGYGDITPVQPLARGLANIEAIIGQLFPATFLARIVTLELAYRRGFRARRAAPVTPRREK
jgi:hypothetical protein